MSVFFRRPWLVGIVVSFACVAGTPHAQVPASAAVEGPTELHCGHLFDSRTGILRGPHVLRIEGGRIAAVIPGADATSTAGTRIVDLGAHTCTPGWIDLHAHLTFRVDARAYDQLPRVEPADLALLGARNARVTLRAGFTTVRNLGDLAEESLALRDAIAQGLIDGPRVFSAGRAITATGGHADYSNGLSQRLAGDPGPADGVLDSADAAFKAVRKRYKEGADVIKVTATGGMLSLSKNGQNPQMRQSELDAVVAAAHDYGLRVAAHAHGLEGIKRALRAGVDTLEHGTLLDDEAIALMKRQGTWYVPTLSSAAHLTEQAQQPGAYPQVVVDKISGLDRARKSAFEKARAAGVRIAFGSDAGPVPHGENAREFIELVAAGLTPAQALQAATIHAAQAMGEEASLGSLEAGKFADIVAVPGDPTSDITLVRKPSFVMKEGRVYLAPD